MPQVSSSFPEFRLGLSEEAHTLAFVWDASKLPHRLIKGARIHQSVTVFPACSHTQLNLHADSSISVMNDSFVIGALKMKCMQLAATWTLLQLVSKHMLLKQHCQHVRIQDRLTHPQEVIFTPILLYLSDRKRVYAGWIPSSPLTGYAHIWATVLWNALCCMSEEIT